jgi:hypothetical protein
LSNRTLHVARLVTALLCGIALAAVISPARADLQISADSSRAAVWLRIYNHLPPCWQTDREIIVREVSDTDLNTDSERSAVAGASDNRPDVVEFTIDGDFQDPWDGLPTIRLAQSLSKRDAPFVFAHEYGHFVWEEKLSRSDRRTYRRIWEDQRDAGRLVTEYAAESVEEGFAEAFATFVQNAGRLRNKDLKSYEFLKSLQRRCEPAGDGESAAP